MDRQLNPSDKYVRRRKFTSPILEGAQQRGTLDAIQRTIMLEIQQKSWKKILFSLLSRRLPTNLHQHVLLIALISLVLYRPPISIFHHSRQVLHATSCIGTQLLYIGSCWSSCPCLCMWGSPQEYITYVFVLTSPAVSRMSVKESMA